MLTYSFSVLSPTAWAKSRDADAALNAEDLLELMEKRYEEGDKDVRPDVHSFCTVINGEFILFRNMFGGECCFVISTLILCA